MLIEAVKGFEDDFMKLREGLVSSNFQGSSLRISCPQVLR